MLPSVSSDFAEKIDAVKAELLKEPQCEYPVSHSIYEGMYHRTVFLPQGALAVGARIRIPTLLIISGHIRTNEGDRMKEYKGYFVLEGSAFRQQVILALEDSYMTMVFPTKAETVQEAEDEFTEESEQLQTRNKELTR